MWTLSLLFYKLLTLPVSGHQKDLRTKLVVLLLRVSSTSVMNSSSQNKQNKGVHLEEGGSSGVPGGSTPGAQQAEAHLATVIQVGVEPHSAPCTATPECQLTARVSGRIWVEPGFAQSL